VEDVLSIYEKEKPEGVIVQFGGQTPLNIANELAEAGVKIVFIDKTPGRGPSLNDLGAGDRKVRKTIKSVLAHSSNVIRVDAPDSEQPWEKSLLNWADNLLNTIEIERDITVDTLDSSFYQIRRRAGDRDIFFMINTDSAKMLTLNAEFSSKGKTAWHWDPETAKRSLYASPVSGPISITLPPHGSMLLVLESVKGPKAAPQKKEPGPGVPLSGTWDCQFLPAQGDAFTKDAFRLIDLGKSKLKKFSTFAGAVTYKKDFRVDDVASADALDLGTVHGVSEVTLNGKPVGTRWYGWHIYDISKAVKPGKNELAIKVTTVLHNYARTLPRNTAAGFWTKNNKYAVPAGLVGPVQLMTEE
ncbi:MAG: hypothetical protein KAJ19_20260, partial [Gammaproteobacteria bacterium]|nr:hypothetical protein [Gammaproteobacteria bacterium]